MEENLLFLEQKHFQSLSWISIQQKLALVWQTAAKWSQMHAH